MNTAIAKKPGLKMFLETQHCTQYVTFFREKNTYALKLFDFSEIKFVNVVRVIAFLKHSKYIPEHLISNQIKPVHIVYLE